MVEKKEVIQFAREKEDEWKYQDFLIQARINKLHEEKIASYINSQIIENRKESSLKLVCQELGIEVIQ